jgi:hypothetical protein
VAVGGRGLAVIAAAIGLAALAGCGGGSTITTEKARPPEVAQKLPKLPSGWKARRDRSVGYAIGVPPGWELQEHGGNVLFRSPDHLVAVTLAADRDEKAFAVPLARFATQALAALPGFKEPLHPSKPRPFKGTPLEAVQSTATGAEAGGLRERATLVVLRRDKAVNYTVGVLENAERQGSRLDRAVALRMIRTLRDQPSRSGRSG